MPNENQNPRNNFAVRHLPWLLGAVMLLIYLVTLNPWVSLLNIVKVAEASGWTWQPQLTSPILGLAMLPFHLLPAGKIPVCLNIFSAICAALGLSMLARSIAILPHDRTETERQRERSDFSFLTGRLAIFPPILAVVLFGLQLGFWEHATNFTGESFELLLFAGIIWQLSEYRLDEAPGRLYLSAFVYGAGIAENWVFVGYFPVFLTAVIWLRKLDFFNLQFLARMTWCGLAGVSFLFLLPLIAALSGAFHLSFWEALHPALNQDWSVISSLSYNFVWHQLALVSLSTLLPVLVMAIRWSSNFGDSSHAGTTLVNYLIYFVHAALFTLCVWVMFDPPISPQQLVPGLYPFFGTPALTFYYLAALGIGYYCGYYLLVFGKSPVRSRRNAGRPDPALPKSWMWLCPVIVGGTFTCAALAIGLLLYKNIPAIRATNDDTLLKFARFTTRNLPAGGAILLNDVDSLYNQPVRGYIIQAMLAREGRAENYPVVNTLALKFSPYQLYLHRQFPDLWPELFKEKQPVVINQLGLLGQLNVLARSNNISYLNPSFGYYFESFYQEPHGLNYTMKLLPQKTLLPPPLDKNLIVENEKFWSEVVESVSPAIEKAAAPVPDQQFNFADWLLLHLHATAEPNPNALYAGTLYSRALNFWGVQLQRAGELDRAATNFIAAQNLNPDNVTAGINLDFNHKLRTGTIPPVDLSRVNPDQFGKSRNWQEIIDANGPFDEISFTFEDGLILAGNGYYRQAIVPFTRVRQLAPDYLSARLQLAQAYIFGRLPDRALEALHDPMTDPARFSLTASNATGLGILLSAAYFQKSENARATDVLEKEIQRHPDNDTLLTGSVQAFMLHGLYTNALAVIAHKLRQTPDDPKWIFAKGYAELRNADYSAASASLTRVLQIQPNDPTALFNRALAYLDSSNLDAAHADFSQLQSSYTNSAQVAFGLGEIAWRRHDNNEAIRNYEVYLANARTNTAEATNVIARLRELKK
jgi:tetratricopeptide (TPR) repeat protein